MKNRLITFTVVLSILFSNIAFAVPEREELRKHRHQLERLRRYMINKVVTNATDQEAVNYLVNSVLKLDLQIMKLAFIEANRDQIAKEEAEQTDKREEFDRLLHE